MKRKLTEQDEFEIQKYSDALAQQWLDWPCSLFTGLGQLFLLNPYFYNKLFFTPIHIQNKLFTFNFHVNNIIFLFIIAEIVWFFSAEKFVSFKLAHKFRWIQFLVYVTSPIVAIILFKKGELAYSILALTWAWFLNIVSGIVFMSIGMVLDFLYNISSPDSDIIRAKMKKSFMDSLGIESQK